jgi:hypothetical protein
VKVNRLTCRELPAVLLSLDQKFPTCGTRSPGGTWWTALGVRENDIGNGGKHPEKELK